MTGCSDNYGWAQHRTSSVTGDPRCSPNKSVSPGWSLFSLAPASYCTPFKSVLTCSALHSAREQHWPKAPSHHWDLQLPALSQRPLSNLSQPQTPCAHAPDSPWISPSLASHRADMLVTVNAWQKRNCETCGILKAHQGAFVLIVFQGI